MPIPDHYLELESIYVATLARGIRSLAVASAVPGEGVTSLIAALTHRNLHAGRSTLVVDFNLFRPGVQRHFGIGSALAQQGLLPAPATVQHDRSDARLAVLYPQPDRTALLHLREPGTIEQLIEDWKKEFDTILVDTSPINAINGANLPGERAAAACDGSVLLVLSGRTTETMAEATAKKLLAAGANLLGIVMNDREQPSLLTEMIREIDRLRPMLPAVADWLQRKVLSTPLLRLEV
ncbi:MAG: CpsD/CapB family tyrosine-protein kinase [Gammaproteobacteria bacterium]|nr:CpsD/CapB family tyrosine-protein kinase [Gammaproteobacteria bacterium]